MPKNNSVCGIQIIATAAIAPPNPATTYTVRRRYRLQNQIPTRHPTEQLTATYGPLIAVTHHSETLKSAPIPENRFVNAKQAVGDTKHSSPSKHPGCLNTLPRSRKKLSNISPTLRVGFAGSGITKR